MVFGPMSIKYVTDQLKGMTPAEIAVIFDLNHNCLYINRTIVAKKFLTKEIYKLDR